MDRIAFSFVLLYGLTCVATGQAQSYRCKSVPLTTETRWGGNMRIEEDFRDKPVRKVRGTVVGPGEGFYSTLVQIYQRQPADPISGPRSQNSGAPMAACVTGNDGRFGFSLPPGEYELRMSQGPGIDVTSAFVTVKHGLRRSRNIKVEMFVGT